MTVVAKEVITMLDMLPQEEQEFACEFIKKLVRAWDPDFTKLTPSEAIELQIAYEQVNRGETYADDEIDWDNLDIMDLH